MHTATHSLLAPCTGPELHAPPAYQELVSHWASQAYTAVAFDYSALLEERTPKTAILHQGPCVTFILDLRALTFNFFSQNSLQLLGYNAAEFVEQGLPFLNQITHPDDLNQSWQLLKQIWDFLQARPAAKRKDYKFNRDYRLTRPDGTHLRVLEQCTVLQQDSAGNITHVMGILSDITRLKKSEVLTGSVTSSLTNRSHCFYAPASGPNSVYSDLRRAEN